MTRRANQDCRRVRIEKWVFHKEEDHDFSDLLSSIVTLTWGALSAVEPPALFTSKGNGDFASVIGYLRQPDEANGDIYNLTVTNSKDRINVILTTNSELVIAKSNKVKTEIKNLLGIKRIQSDDDELKI